MSDHVACRSLWRSEVGGDLYCSGGTYIPPFVHCASSTISKLECMMNWFMYCAVSGKRKRAMPSPPPLDVPNAMLKIGVSVGERIVK